MVDINESYDELRRTAERAAREAGRVALGGFRGPMKITAKGYQDIVTQYDTAAEEAALSILREAHPTHDILAEESGKSLNSESEAHFMWAIDPIDGTHNYASQLPFWCSSVACLSNDKGGAVAGSIYDALHDEMFSATLGGGAYLNGEPIATTGTENLSEAFLLTDIGYGAELAHRMTALAPWVQSHTRRFRLLGSAVLSMAYVACGRVDGYYHLSLQPWDVAAAALLVREAGGNITTWEGSSIPPGTQTSAVAANPHLQPALRLMLVAGDAHTG